MKKKKILTAAEATLAFFACVLSVRGGEGPLYYEVDLGVLGDGPTTNSSWVYSWVYNINNKGQIVGDNRVSRDLTYSFLYSDSAVEIISVGPFTHVNGINDFGQIIGHRFDNPQFGAFLYSNGSIQYLPLPKGATTYAEAINNKGQIAGHFYFLSDGTASGERIFLYSSDGSVRNIEIPAGRRSITVGALNESGQIVGSTRSLVGRSTRIHGFLYSDGVLRDIGTFGGDESSASDINDDGHVVGWASIDIFKRHAYLCTGGVMKDLGTLGGDISGASGINNLGQIVGESTANVSLEFLDYRAFLYSGHTMYDLNDLVINPTPDWKFYSAREINDIGQIIGSKRDKRGWLRPFLLNPVSLEWKKVIEREPRKPSYGECPVKEPGKDSLVVVTHGWIKPFDDPDASTAWVDDTVCKIRGYLDSKGLSSWQVVGYRWVEDARVSSPQTALKNAAMEGESLGRCLTSEGWSHIHFIAHSAGSALIQSATDIIKANSPTTTVHETFLDAFVGFDYDNVASYGKGADWADNYFSHDLLTGGETWPFTEGLLEHAYNVDVTLVDRDKEEKLAYFSTPSGLRSCPQGISSHRWPVMFYESTIPPNRLDGLEGFGFTLSKEFGSFDVARTSYPVGRNSLRVLGKSNGNPCDKLFQTTPPVIGSPLDFSNLLLRQSPTGLVQKNGGSVRLTTDSLAWVTAFVAPTNSVNFISFATQFLSVEGASGLLSVYWDTNLVGSVDERAVRQGLQGYSLGVPRVLANSVYALGFRLDAFTDVQSSVLITNVTFASVGVSKPFALSITDEKFEGRRVFQLTGESGFTYSVETSTNLIDWETFALLVNTNGIVRFADTVLTNAPARFYRAAAP